MPINSNEFNNEVIKLKETKNWIDIEKANIERSDNELKSKIGELKKQSRGNYNEELETMQKLYEITHKNLKNYTEAHAHPYFARIDFREYRREMENFYIGKHSLGDLKTGEEVVIDWRAPIADLYYSGTQGEAYYESPGGIINGELSLKRKFLIKDGRLVDAFDEGINEIILKSGESNKEGSALIDEFLRINLEESISTKLKEVVATIQKEQNDIIRAEKNSAIIVQGSAGSGKTTVALHRLAYLLYKYKSRLNPKEVLVIAPNKLFLDYISEVLPNLGVDKVSQKTYDELALEILGIKRKIYTKDKKLADMMENKNESQLKLIRNSSKLKASRAFKLMMDRYIKILENCDMEIEDITVEGYILFDKKEVKRLFSKDLINLPINRRKAEIKRYLGLKINEKIVAILDKIDFSFEYQVARTKKTMEDGPERRKVLIEIYNERDNKKENIKVNSKTAFDQYFISWSKINNAELYYDLFNNEEVFQLATADKIPKELAEFMKKEVMENIEDNIIDSDDLAPMLYVKFKTDGVPEHFKFQHVVLDEAQDYSVFQFYTVKEMTTSDSLTIVGDIGQGIYTYKGIDSWSRLYSDIYKDTYKYMPLTQSYRSTIEIIELANKVLLKQGNNLPPAIPVLRHGKAPEIIAYNKNSEFAQNLDKIVEEVEASGKNSIAVIGKNHSECRKIRDILKKNSKFQWELVKENDATLNLKNIIIPSYMTKGLEFDCTVVFNCSNDNYSNNELDNKLLYVVLTRALHYEYVFYCGNISELLLD